MTGSAVQDSSSVALGDHLQRLEKLLDDLQAVVDPSIQGKTREVVQTLLEFHAAAVARMLEQITQAGEASSAILDAMLADELTSSLLLLHGLHPLDLQTRVRRALDKVRPALQLHGGEVELLEVTPDGVVRLRLQGSCHGCPSSQMTLKSTIEEAICAAAPDAADVQVEGVVEEAPLPTPAGFVPLSQVTTHRAPAHAAV